MPLTAAQICSLAQGIARCPGFTTQAGNLLNSILSDLCQNYDFDVARQSYPFTFQPGQINFQSQAYQNLPANYLRGIRNGSYYIISGVPYPMIPCDQVEEYNMLVQQSNLSNFPVYWASDMSLTGVANSPTGSGGAAVPVALFWEVPSGAYQAFIYYFSQMPDIANAASSTTIPWFPNQTYLIGELAGRLCQLTDDERADALLSSDEDAHPQGSRVELIRYLKMKDDKGTRTKQVQLDRRAFGSSWDRLRNTKSIGWTILFTLMSDGVIHALSTGAQLWTSLS
jgi:hypothetical protein